MPIGTARFKKFDFSIVFLAIWLVIHFQFFFESNVVWEKHPLSFPYMMEVYMVIGIIFFGYCATHLYISEELKLLLFISIFFISFMAISALSANIKFGQPVIYGLIDTRRSLSILSIFCFYLASKRLNLNFNKFFIAITLAACFQLSMSLIFQTVLADFLINRATPSLDERKLRIANGGYLYCFYGIVCICGFCNFNKKYYLGLCLIPIVGILFVAQSRFLLSAFVLTCVIRLSLRYRVQAVATIAAGLFAYFVVLLSGDSLTNSYLGVFINRISDKLNFTEILTSGDAIRATTTEVIFRSLSYNYYIGMGSLSLQWNDGFAAYFGKYFFLSDVGLIGEFYQVGMFYPLLLTGCAIFFVYLIKNSQSDIGMDCVIALVIFIILSSMLGGLFYNSGYYIAAIYLVSKVKSPRNDS